MSPHVYDTITIAFLFPGISNFNAGFVPQFEGVMTIGALAHSVAKEHEAGGNPDFLSLLECRRRIAEALEVAPQSLELSMGMSGDFEEAVRMGSTEVRVGSSIFGARKYPNK